MGILRRLFVGLVWVVGLGVGVVIALVLLLPRLHHAPTAPAPSSAPASSEQIRAAGDVQVAIPQVVVPSGGPPATDVTAPAVPIITDCSAKGYDAATAANAASLRTLAWKPFHRPEIGWETYAPRIAQEIGVACGPDSPGFAEALSRWQKKHRLPATGMLDEATFTVMNGGGYCAAGFIALGA